MLRIRKLLFPTDFSEAAEAAALHALHLARRYGAVLHVLHVATPHEDAAERVHGFQRTACRSGLAGAPRVIKAQLRSRSAPAGILDYAVDQGVDLVVMGTRGRSGLRRLVIGSVAEAVVRQAPCPVYTVHCRGGGRAEDAKDEAAAPSVQRILAPVDFSASSRQALAYARELADAYGARVDVLHITAQADLKTGQVAGVKPTGPSRRERERQRLRAWAEEMDLAARVHVQYSYPQGGILDFASRRGTDLIVIATHGRTGLKRLVMGSVAEQVVRRAPCPVFTVKSFGLSLLEESEERAALSEARG